MDSEMSFPFQLDGQASNSTRVGKVIKQNEFPQHLRQHNRYKLFIDVAAAAGRRQPKEWEAS